MLSNHHMQNKQINIRENRWTITDGQSRMDNQGWTITDGQSRDADRRQNKKHNK